MPLLSKHALENAVALALGASKPLRAARNVTSNRTTIEQVHDWSIERVHGAIRESGLSIELSFPHTRPLGRDAPCLFLSNHPKGVLDTAVLLIVANILRSNAQYMAWDKILGTGQTLPSNVIPVSFGSGTSAANAKALRAARLHLQSGNDVFLTPAGGVPFPSSDNWVPKERAWSRAVGLLATKAGCQVVPIHVHGQMSTLPFYMRYFGGHMKVLGLVAQLGIDARSPQRVTVGPGITASQVRDMGDASAITEELRRICIAPQTPASARTQIIDTAADLDLFADQVRSTRDALMR